MYALSDLNPQQRLAVETISGPIIIVAGPGTGKTKTLISRIVYLIDQGNNPESILALTFTRKAAIEMRERLQQSLPNLAALPFIGTFHALAYDFLKNHKDLNLLTETEHKLILQTLKAQFPAEIGSLRELALQLSRLKNKPETSYDKILAAYQKQLDILDKVDFDDMILQSHKLLKTDSQLRQSIQEKYQFILVDEFQDTNELQYQFLKLLLKSQPNIFVIGDPLQSIYSFRGASDQIFDLFKRDFNDYQEITLQTNYRSARSIIRVSLRLFPETPSLQPHIQEDGSVTIVKTQNEFTESEWIVNQICRKVGGVDLNQAASMRDDDEQLTWSDFAVIYRTHHFRRILEKEFLDSGIPYQIIGGESIYEQPEISFLSDCLVYINDPISTNWSKLKQYTFPLSQNILLSVKKTQRVSQIILFLISTFHINETIQDKPEKKLNLQQYINNLTQFDKRNEGLKECIEYLRYLEEHDYYDKRSSHITLLTMHAAKGLEFNTVFICGFEDGLIPLINKKTESNLDEEKRLLYVALTRAKQNLFLLHTHDRHRQLRNLSRFKKYLDCPELKIIEDEKITKLAIKQKKENDKKSQLSIF